MSKSRKGVWLLLLWLLLASCSQIERPPKPPQAAQGVLDLQNWDFNENGQVDLSGEWVFYWQELLNPSQIGETADFIYASVPNNWTAYEVNGQMLPPEGYGTFRLTVHLPDPKQAYGLFIEGEGTAYNLWVDGKLLAQNGKVAANAQDMVPQSKPEVVFFQPEGDTTEFVIQISNWQHRKAGFRNDILLGLASQIHQDQRDHWAEDAFVMGVFLIMGLYHLFIFGFRPGDKGPLYFAIWSFINFIRAGLLNQKLFIFFFPAMSWELALHIEYLTFFFSAPIYAIFIRELYPRDIPRRVMQIVLGLGIAFSVFMFFISTLTLSYIPTIYQGIIILEMIYFAFFIRRILVNKREGAVYIAVGSVIAFAGIISEILYLQNISTFKASSVYTFLAFILIQAVLLSSRLSKSFHRVEVLSDKLEEANISLLESEKKYRSIFEESKDMIFIAGIDEHIKAANPASKDVLGYTLDELRSMKLSDLLVDQQDKDKVEKILSKQDSVKDIELELKRKDSRRIHGLVTLTIRKDESGNATELQGNIHDVSSRIQAESERVRAMEFEKLAITDPLTHVYNRRVFDEIAVKELTRALRGGSNFSIVLLDIDHFKQINDTYGHAVGDQVLIQLAKLCLANTRSMDIFARYGGEEFVILMPDTGQDSTFQSMERLRMIIQEAPMAASEGADIFVTVSMGIAEMDAQDTTDIQTILEYADRALYTSKESGRNRVTVWSKKG